MRNRAVFIAVVAAFVATTALPAAAQTAADTQVSLFAGDTTLAVGQPFHVAHGWEINPRTDPPFFRMPFVLAVDGAEQPVDDIEFAFVPRSERQNPDEWFEFRYVTNFDDGLAAGVYHLEGFWYAPCWWASQEGYYGGSCGSGLARFALVEAAYLDITLTVE